MGLLSVRRSRLGLADRADPCPYGKVVAALPKEIGLTTAAGECAPESGGGFGGAAFVRGKIPRSVEVIRDIVREGIHGHAIIRSAA